MNTIKKIALLILFISFNYSLVSQDFTILGTNDPPFKYFEGDRNNAKGIVVDILKEALGEMDLDPVFYIVDSDVRIQSELKSGRAQMAMLYSYRPEREESFIYPTESFIRLSWNFFYRTEDIGKIHYNSFDDFKGLFVGVINGISYTDEFMNSGLDYHYLPKKGNELEMLNLHRIDLIALPSIITLYEINQKSLESSITYFQKPLKSKLYYNVFGNNTDSYDMHSLITEYDDIIKEMKASGRIKEIFENYLGEDVDLSGILVE